MTPYAVQQWQYNSTCNTTHSTTKVTTTPMQQNDSTHNTMHNVTMAATTPMWQDDSACDTTHGAITANAYDITCGETL